MSIENIQIFIAKILKSIYNWRTESVRNFPVASATFSLNYLYTCHLKYFILILYKKSEKSNWDFRIWSKTLMELIFNPCGEFRWSPEGPVSQIHAPHLHDGAFGIFSGLLRSVQIPKREWDFI